MMILTSSFVELFCPEAFGDVVSQDAAELKAAEGCEDIVVEE